MIITSRRHILGDLLDIAVELREHVDADDLGWKRADRLGRDFGYRRLRTRARRHIVDALHAVGLQARPSLLTCGERDLIQLDAVGDPISSTALVSQLITWHEHNWSGIGEGGHYGEWLRCLRITRALDRQLIWHRSGITGVVTFAGWIRRCEGFYEGWGSVYRLPKPISRDVLLADPRTCSRFDAHGIKALQGLPIGLSSRIARAITSLAGGIGGTDVPLDEPDYSEEPILWADVRGLCPEAVIEAAVASRARLWRELGFQGPPVRQAWLGAAGRADLIRGDVVAETKRVVTVTNGPDQIERYLDYRRRAHGRPIDGLRGVLLQCAEYTSDAVIDRLSQSRFNLELWSVVEDGGWQLERLA